MRCAQSYSAKYTVHANTSPKLAGTAQAGGLPSSYISTHTASQLIRIHFLLHTVCCTPGVAHSAAGEADFHMRSSAEIPPEGSPAVISGAWPEYAESSPNQLATGCEGSPTASWNTFDPAWDGHVPAFSTVDQMVQWQSPGFQVQLQQTAPATSFGVSAGLGPLLESRYEEEEGENYAAVDIMVDTSSESGMGPVSHSPAESVIVCASTMLDDETRDSTMWDASHLE